MLVEILVGPIGGGKSTYARSTGGHVISQDLFGRVVHMIAFNNALEDNVPHIVIDRMNFNKLQRAKYIKPALEAGYEVKITCIFLSYQECLKRVLVRENHPTIAKGDKETAEKVLKFFFNNLELPHPDEYKVTP